MRNFNLKLLNAYRYYYNKIYKYKKYDKAPFSKFFELTRKGLVK